MQFDGLSEFYRTWPASDVAQWPGKDSAELAKVPDKGGIWTGGELPRLPSPPLERSTNSSPVMSSSIDEFPFVGAVPDREGHFLAAGFNGHGSSPISTPPI